MKEHLDIDRIAFIGRTYDEYMKIFNLDECELAACPVLDCPAGAASFAAEAHQLGIDITACDILYDLPAGELAFKGEKDIKHIYAAVDKVPHLYRWDYYRDRDELIAHRQRALELFVSDYSQGRKVGRYAGAELPHLPFEDKAFRLVLSSHFLFLYGDRLSLDFHNACLKELLRVSSGEVRIYPLQGLDAKPYPHMDYVFLFLKSEGIPFEIAEVPFEFQRGANKMLTLYGE